MKAFSEWMEAFEEYYIEAAEFIDAGDHVVVPTHQWGKGKTSGTPVDLEVTTVYTLKEGKIVVLREYDNTQGSPQSRGAVGARRSRRLLSLRDTARAMSQERP
jgi:ketosteroid isomerase-like protein